MQHESVLPYISYLMLIFTRFFFSVANDIKGIEGLRKADYTDYVFEGVSLVESWCKTTVEDF